MFLSLVTTIPPSPQTLRFFNGCMLKQVAELKKPAVLPSLSALIAWHASSTMDKLYLFAILLIDFMSQIRPDQCTGTIALVLVVIAPSMLLGSIL